MRTGFLALAAACAAAVPVSPVATAGPPKAITGTALVAQLAAGHSYDGQGIRIIGDVDLHNIPVVNASLRCESCTLIGRLVAPDTAFHDVIDLTETQVSGPVDLRGASFARSFVWSHGTARSTVDLDFAGFAESAVFDGLTVEGQAGFAGVRFNGDAMFAATHFAGPVTFEAATFSAAAVFSSALPAGGAAATQATFAMDAVFRSAVFNGQADFRRRIFGGTLDFSGVTCTAFADFAGAVFIGAASFAGDTFASGVSFTLTHFAGPAEMTRLTVGRDLNLDVSTIDGVNEHGIDLDLTGTTVAGTLSLAHVLHRGKLVLGNANADRIVFDPHDIDWILGPNAQMLTLERIEATERAAGHAAVANDARYARLSMAGDRGSGWWRAVGDRFFYRQIGGYLARPLRPLRAMAVLLAIGIVVRMAGSRPWQLAQSLPSRLRRRPTRSAPRPGQGPRSPRRNPRRRMERFAERAVHSSAEALRAAVRRAPPQLPEQPVRVGRSMLAGVLWLEYLAFKALAVVFLLCVANANETLHQFIESILGR